MRFTRITLLALVCGLALVKAAPAGTPPPPGNTAQPQGDSPQSQSGALPIRPSYCRSRTDYGALPSSFTPIPPSDLPSDRLHPVFRRHTIGMHSQNAAPDLRKDPSRARQHLEHAYKLAKDEADSQVKNTNNHAYHTKEAERHLAASTAAFHMAYFHNDRQPVEHTTASVLHKALADTHQGFADAIKKKEEKMSISSIVNE